MTKDMRFSRNTEFPNITIVAQAQSVTQIGSFTECVKTGYCFLMQLNTLCNTGRLSAVFTI